MGRKRSVPDLKCICGRFANISLERAGRTQHKVGMHVASMPNRNSRPTYLLRESYREDGCVKNQTLAKLSSLPLGRIELIRWVLKGEQVVEPRRVF